MQVNVLGAERRRRWSYGEKVRLVEETLQAGETVCGVARRHGMAHSLLLTWRRQTRQVGWAEIPCQLSFPSRSRRWRLRSRVTQPASSPPAQRARTGIIEIEFGGGCRVRVDRDVDRDAAAGS
ncbi:transposase [Bradyrhizobium sp. 76]|nr:transposase [Bradyrhizobium sp. 76]